jgi:hypothetical protein
MTSAPVSIKAPSGSHWKQLSTEGLRWIGQPLRCAAGSSAVGGEPGRYKSILRCAAGYSAPNYCSGCQEASFRYTADLTNPCSRASHHLIFSQVVRGRLSADIIAWCPDSQSCDRAKVTRQFSVALTSSPFQPVVSAMCMWTL